MKRTCASCSQAFRSFNPLRSRCDDCREQSESVLLATAENELEANVWRDVLAQEGIGSATRQTDPVAARWQSQPQPFSVDVLVLMKDLPRARELLDLGHEGFFASSLESIRGGIASDFHVTRAMLGRTGNHLDPADPWGEAEESLNWERDSDDGEKPRP